jgi:hypothetical protein
MIEVAQSYEYDVVWHVQADVSYSDWGTILDAAKSSNEEYDWGVYAPNIDDTFYVSSRTDVFDLKDKLTVVATTDCSCWMVKGELIDQMRSNLHLMETNHLGWGWDLIMCGFSHIQNRKVIRDYKFTIDHPASTGYKKEQAESEMADMFDKCPDNLKEAIYLIKIRPQSIRKYYGLPSPINTFIYNA